MFKKTQQYLSAKIFLVKLSKFPNVKVIDFSHVDYPDNLFMNTIHLNYYGAKRFTKELKAEMVRKNIYYKYGVNKN